MRTKEKARIFFSYSFIEKSIYILFMVVAFSSRIGSLVVPHEVSKAISLIVLLYVGLVALRRGRGFDRLEIAADLFKIYFIPVLLIHLYSIIMIMVGKMDGEFFNWNLSAYAPVITAIASVYLFGGKALKYNFIAVVLSWSISVMASLINNGIGVFLFAIRQAYFGDYTPVLGVATNYLELHDIVLSIGMVGVYYVYKTKAFKRKDIMLAIISLAIFLLGMKRIAIAGFVCAAVLALFFKTMSKKRINRYRVIVGSVISAMSIGFVYLIFSGRLYDILSGVNLMGRNYYYDVIKSYGEFSPTFIGTGRNSTSLILTRYHSYLNVGGVHSDTLKMFIENGFIVFMLWLIYYLFMVPKIIMRKFNVRAMGLYLCLSVYAFIIYLTDNVENYYIFQILFVIIPCCYYLNVAKNKTNDREMKK